ncbi:MAG: putative CoA-binding protein [Planctomycetota bacterium]|jgi:predicted CoA-binding protein
MNFKTLVLGASLKEDRYSNRAIKSLVKHDVETVAFGLRKGIVAGVEIETERVAFENLHSITLYLNPKRQEEYYNYILSLKPKRVIFNPGTENYEFMEILKENKISYEVACTLVMLSIGNYKEEIE